MPGTQSVLTHFTCESFVPFSHCVLLKETSTPLYVFAHHSCLRFKLPIPVIKGGNEGKNGVGERRKGLGEKEKRKERKGEGEGFKHIFSNLLIVSGFVKMVFENMALISKVRELIFA